MLSLEKNARPTCPTNAGLVYNQRGCVVVCLFLAVGSLQTAFDERVGVMCLTVQGCYCHTVVALLLEQHFCELLQHRCIRCLFAF